MAIDPKLCTAADGIDTGLLASQINHYVRIGETPLNAGYGFGQVWAKEAFGSATLHPRRLRLQSCLRMASEVFGVEHGPIVGGFVFLEYMTSAARRMVLNEIREAVSRVDLLSTPSIKVAVSVDPVERMKPFVNFQRLRSNVGRRNIAEIRLRDAMGKAFPNLANSASAYRDIGTVLHLDPEPPIFKNVRQRTAFMENCFRELFLAIHENDSVRLAALGIGLRVTGVQGYISGIPHGGPTVQFREGAVEALAALRLLSKAEATDLTPPRTPDPNAPLTDFKRSSLALLRESQIVRRDLPPLYRDALTYVANLLSSAADGRPAATVSPTLPACLKITMNEFGEPRRGPLPDSWQTVYKLWRAHTARLPDAKQHRWNNDRAVADLLRQEFQTGNGEVAMFANRRANGVIAVSPRVAGLLTELLRSRYPIADGNT